jgi:hypothetical protein
MKQRALVGPTFQPAWMLAALLLAAWIVLAAGTYTGFTGNLWILTGFHLAFICMLALLVLKPRVDAYSFLAIFMFLGFWMKFTIHQWIHYAFVEPVGSFSGEPQQWDRALAAAAAAACGVSLCRGLYLWWRRRHGAAQMGSPQVPDWYRRLPSRVWMVVAALALVLYAANSKFAFFVTGVQTRLVLPFRLDALLAWTVYCGAAMLVMLLADWEYQRRPDRLWPLILALSAIGVLMSASMLSRANTLFLFSALAMTCIAHQRIALRRFYQGFGWTLPLGMAAALATSLVLVSAIRLRLYEVPAPVPVVQLVPATASPGHVSGAPPAAPVSAPSGESSTVAPPTQQHLQMTSDRMLHQVLLLITDRWIGLEGVLALSANHELGLPLLRAGLLENPAVGVHAIYQRIAHTTYVFQPGFTYLTLPGFPVVLDYSGSLLIVGAGMFVACAVICLIDGLASRVTESPLLTAWMGLLLANAICQMSFPYLTLVFICLCILSLLGLYLLTRALAEWVEAAA